MWKLTIVDDEGKRTDLLLSRGEYTIGRDEGNTVRLTDRNISRKHMLLRKQEGAGWVIEDLSSYNGVFVNSERVSSAQPLAHGDVVQVGDYRLEVADEARAEVTGATTVATTHSAPPTARVLDRPDRFVVVDGAAAGTEYPLDSERTVIGRAEDAEISINHSSVSRVHAEVVRVAEGVYEIFDRGSSNGIRVNGIKAERRVVENEDEVELGDVRLRFVARGKVFRPGVVAPAIGGATHGDATATGPQRKQRKGGLGVMVAIGAALGVIAVIVIVALRPSQGGSSASSPVAAIQDDQSALEDARRLAEANDLDGAHAALAKIPEASPLRHSGSVKDLEGKWADSKFQQASYEPDVQKRRAILGQIAEAALLDQDRRNRAADEIRTLDLGGTDPGALPVAAASVDAGANPAQSGGLLANGLAANPFDSPGSKGSAQPATTRSAPGDKPDPKPPATSTGTAGVKNDVLTGADGQDRARKALEPRVFGGRGTVEEIRMLRAICRAKHDNSCVSRCTALLKDKAP